MQSRRQFVGAGLATVAMGKSAVAQGMSGRVTKPHVVVIGGGAGGASAARRIAKTSGGSVDVTLVEANKTYTSCFFSNHYLGGFRPMNTLRHNYANLTNKYGISLVHDRAVNVDRKARKIELERSFLRYDLLVLAPGIDFVEGSVNGWSLSNADRMPHAYMGGEQIAALRRQIDTMPQGGIFAMVVPSGKYRCPPGPYERATVVAHMLNKSNPTAKIIIVDPKPLFSKMSLFREAWSKYYKGMIEMNSDVDMSKFEVDPKAMTIKLDGEIIKVDVGNIIPDQKAGVIAQISGVTEQGWAPVHANDMRSKLDDNIYVLGDAAEQGDMPKSSFAANSQAKVCAEAILSRLLGREQKISTFTNTCWSLLAPEDTVKIGGQYQATPEGIKRLSGFSSQRKEDVDQRKKNYSESLDWYNSIILDMFG